MKGGIPLQEFGAGFQVRINIMGETPGSTSWQYSAAEVAVRAKEGGGYSLDEVADILIDLCTTYAENPAFFPHAVFVQAEARLSYGDHRINTPGPYTAIDLSHTIQRPVSYFTGGQDK